MNTGWITLCFQRDAPKVRLRELTGHDERLVSDTTTATAVELLNRLVYLPVNCEWGIPDLAAPDRDRLLAEVYGRTYGRKIDSTSTCTGCASPFDLAFTLDDLLSTVERTPASRGVEPVPDGTFRAGNGRRFRLPTARDEIEAAALPADEAARALARRCAIPETDDAEALAELEETIEELAPVLDLEIGTTCPECGAAQSVHFDMQYYLLRAIAQERAQFTREIHRIASGYGWSLEEILRLPRSERRAFVDWIESEVLARRRTS